MTRIQACAAATTCSQRMMICQVLTGYFGPLPGGLLKQLGRGYSDLCAALAAVGTKAKELQVGYSLRCLCVRKVLGTKWLSGG